MVKLKFFSICSPHPRRVFFTPAELKPDVIMAHRFCAYSRLVVVISPLSNYLPTVRYPYDRDLPYALFSNQVA